MFPKQDVQLHHHARAPRGQLRTDIRADLFDGPTIAVAKRLIGATLYRRIPAGEPDAGELLSGRIVETEAYLPLVDPSCHGYRGPTPRTATLFGRRGFAYVYLIYGMYFCLNVTTEPPGIGAAVLIRALEPLAGVEAMQKRRGSGIPVEALASGPGNLCRALAIDLRADGADLRQGDLVIAPASPLAQTFATSGRIGLSSAQAWPLRFFDPHSLSVSPYRRRRVRPKDLPRTADKVGKRTVASVDAARPAVI
ncbi:MAG: DNA-3-methyladenine glycosylase [Candidatus Eremiobacteraeota bacterium]|nr:DNA-3-methyladenine glycosylase [Candidatus Eremiobacteraeota bacterium]